MFSSFKTNDPQALISMFMVHILLCGQVVTTINYHLAICQSVFKLGTIESPAINACYFVFMSI